jgi:hypothetical protein
MHPPAGIPTMPGSFVAIDISANDTAHPTWSTPIRDHFRPDGATSKRDTHGNLHPVRHERRRRTLRGD